MTINKIYVLQKNALVILKNEQALFVSISKADLANTLNRIFRFWSGFKYDITLLMEKSLVSHWTPSATSIVAYGGICHQIRILISLLLRFTYIRAKKNTVAFKNRPYEICKCGTQNNFNKTTQSQPNTDKCLLFISAITFFLVFFFFF